jgi:hypothetical protein
MVGISFPEYSMRFYFYSILTFFSSWSHAWKKIYLRAAGVPAVHAGAAHPYGDRKGEEPLAKCGRTLGCTPAGTTWNIYFYECCGQLDPDLHWECGSGSSRAKKGKSEEMNCFEGWIFSFVGFQASPVALTSFTEANRKIVFFHFFIKIKTY